MLQTTSVSLPGTSDHEPKSIGAFEQAIFVFEQAAFHLSWPFKSSVLRVGDWRISCQGTTVFIWPVYVRYSPMTTNFPHRGTSPVCTDIVAKVPKYQATFFRKKRS
jgi:hypothetical protein